MKPMTSYYWLLLLVCCEAVPTRLRDNKGKKCGESNTGALDSSRIVGGEPVVGSEWPWQVVITQEQRRQGRGSRVVCGGTLVHPFWVLTAAHCVIHPFFHFVVPASKWLVRAGETILGSEQRHVYRVAQVVPHPTFNDTSWQNDIALVRLSTPVNTSSLHDPSVNVVCLPDNHQQLDFDTCCITGWGQTTKLPPPKDGPRIKHRKRVVLSLILRKAKAPLLSAKDCEKAYNGIGNIAEGMLCAGTTDGSSGPCIGDSGGPLQCLSQNGRWFQIGVSSWGAGCAEPGYPGVFTRLTSYMTWIRDTMRNASLEEPD